MNDEATLESRPAFAKVRVTRPPTLIVRVELEQPPWYQLDTETFEDEQRLRVWLRSSRAIWDLHTDLERLLDAREENGGKRAA